MRNGTWIRLLLILAILTPLAVLFLLPAGGMMMNGMWLWLVLILCFIPIWSLLGVPVEAEAAAMPAGPSVLPPEQQAAALHEIIDVRVATELGGVRTFRGPLKQPPEAAYEAIKHQVGPSVVPLIKPDETTRSVGGADAGSRRAGGLGAE